MDRIEPARIGIVGTGRLAASLAAALHRAGYVIATVAGRTPESGAAFAARLGFAVTAVGAADVVEGSDTVFLCVPDDAIAAAARGLPWQEGQLAVHCSGALGAAVLAGACAPATAACLHPIQSFPSREPEPDRFAGITCGIEGAGAGGALLETIVQRLGAIPLPLDGVDRARYHAAAVLASNSVVALMSAARRTWALAGLPPEMAQAALAPLLQAVAANLGRLPVEAALTGPVARGDAETVARHLDALATDPGLRELYRLLALELTGFAPADPAARARIIEQLTPPEL